MVEHNFHLNFLVIFTCFVSVLLDQIMLIWVQFNRFLPPAAVVDPGKGPSLILDQTKGPKAKNFFGDPPPPLPLSQGSGCPPSLSQGLDPALCSKVLWAISQHSMMRSEVVQGGSLKGTQSAMGPCWPGHYFCQFEKCLAQPKIKSTRPIHLEIRFNPT